MTQREKELIDQLTEEFRATITEKIIQSKSLVMHNNSSESKFTNYYTCVSEYFCVGVDQVLTKNYRHKNIVVPRQILWFLCRTGESAIPYSLSKIGELCGGFDHATVLHGSRKIADLIDYDYELKRDLSNICMTLGFRLEKIGLNYTVVNA